MEVFPHILLKFRVGSQYAISNNATFGVSLNANKIPSFKNTLSDAFVFVNVSGDLHGEKDRQEVLATTTKR